MRSGRGKRTILVVEDDPRLRDLYRSALSQAGFAVVAVEDGVDALRVVETQRPPAAVVLDLMLPRRSGRDVGYELKASPATCHVPIIVVTGTDASDIRGLSVDCVLRKPVLPEQLVEAVDLCVRKLPTS